MAQIESYNQSLRRLSNDDINKIDRELQISQQEKKKLNDLNFFKLKSEHMKEEPRFSHVEFKSFQNSEVVNSPRVI